jgi:metal-responsive CopG/Arc/MetJ family transcriptional regulator
MATKTLNIALDETLIKKIDMVVKRDMGSRSEYFRQNSISGVWQGR